MTKIIFFSWFAMKSCVYFKKLGGLSVFCGRLRAVFRKKTAKIRKNGENLTFFYRKVVVRGVRRKKNFFLDSAQNFEFARKNLVQNYFLVQSYSCFSFFFQSQKNYFATSR